MVSTSKWLGGGVLVAAGLFQFTPWKHACLKHCRSPLDFLLTGWREGTGGALSMGVRQGVSCTGCCWVLMALLFVLGVMNLAWVAAITGFVVLEKTVRGKWVSVVSGTACVAWGLLVLTTH
jgi:predicted metal-binding membrane protein